MRIAQVFMLLMSLCGCMGAIEAPAGPNDGLEGPAKKGPKTVVTLMLAERSYFAETFMLDGCAAWEAKDVGCAFTEDPTVADAFIRFDRSPCVVKDDGTYILAIAHWQTRDIVLYTSCLALSAGTGEGVLARYRETAIVVAAHELGHLFGIRDHVPASCMEPHEETADGISVCGTAVMNPLIDARLHGFITAYDAYAFDLRRTNESLVDLERRGLKSATPHDCTLRVDPR